MGSEDLLLVSPLTVGVERSHPAVRNQRLEGQALRQRAEGVAMCVCRRELHRVMVGIVSSQVLTSTSLRIHRADRITSLPGEFDPPMADGGCKRAAPRAWEGQAALGGERNEERRCCESGTC